MDPDEGPMAGGAGLYHRDGGQGQGESGVFGVDCGGVRKEKAPLRRGLLDASSRIYLRSLAGQNKSNSSLTFKA